MIDVVRIHWKSRNISESRMALKSIKHNRCVSHKALPPTLTKFHLFSVRVQCNVLQSWKVLNYKQLGYRNHASIPLSCIQLTVIKSGAEPLQLWRLSHRHNWHGPMSSLSTSTQVSYGALGGDSLDHRIVLWIVVVHNNQLSFVVSQLQFTRTNSLLHNRNRVGAGQ